MIKDIITSNNEINVTNDKIDKLKELFPNCFSKSGKFDITSFEEEIKTNTSVLKEGYGLNFLGKNYAKYIASLDTESVLVPDEENNNKEENINSENIYISGDNIDALKHLVKSYANKIKCIYIDPPYNTGSDGFIYNDKFNFTNEKLEEVLDINDEEAKRISNMTNTKSNSHSAWLTFIYPRLYLAKQLLSDDGIIFISIDDNEATNLKLLCDNIYGEENFIGMMTLMSNPRGSQNSKHLSYIHEYILAYSKNEELLNLSGVNKLEENLSEYKEIDEDGKKYRLLGLRKRGGAWRKEDRPNMHYPIYINPNDGSVSLEKNNNFFIEVIPKRPSGELGRWCWGKEKVKKYTDLLVGKKINRQNEENAYDIFRKDYLENEKGEIKLTKLKTIWTEKETNYQNAKNEIKELFDNSELFDYPKPTYLMDRLIEICIDDDDYVLDFFSGSGSTAHAVMKYNLKNQKNIHYMMVQLEEKIKKDSQAYKIGYETIDELGQERIKRAAKKIKEETNVDIDYGFKHYTIKEVDTNTLDKLEKFEPNWIEKDKTVVDEFGINSILTTWMVKDGYGLTDKHEKLILKGYEAYKWKNTIYLINSDMSSESIKCLIEKYENEENFECNRIVLFGYSFTLSEIQTLKDNLKQVKNIKNINVDVLTRY